MKIKSKQEREPAKAEDVKICNLCGEMIIGDYDYVRTRRKTEMYFHKGMSCRKETKNDRETGPSIRTVSDR